jgi:DnaK suppressor protein
MSALSEDQRQRLAVQLRDRERELYADIQREQGKDEGDWARTVGAAPDAGEYSVHDLESDLHHAEIGRDIGELRAIGDALQRIRTGDYGVCIDCGGNIPFERLQAQPTARRCIDCQRRYDRTHAGGERGPTL